MDRIYLVDDQPIANFITRKLLELEGYTGCIMEFNDAEEALNAISLDEENPLIFLDINMPGTNGWEFLEKLKQQKADYDIILLTSSTSKFDREKAAEYPSVIKYMEKPLTKAKFSEITELLENYCKH